MQNILQAQPKIDAVFTHDDDMAQGVVQAIKNANRDKEMWLTGVGGSKAAMDQIKQGGLYRATFLYNPTMAASAVALARLLAKGQGLSDLTEPVIPNLIVMQARRVQGQRRRLPADRLLTRHSQRSAHTSRRKNHDGGRHGRARAARCASHRRTSVTVSMNSGFVASGAVSSGDSTPVNAIAAAISGHAATIAPK